MSTLIQNGVLLCPGGPVNADLRVVGEKIAEIGLNLPAGDSRVLDASGKLVFPGFIDTHTHFEMNKGKPNETADDWASGTLAALAGGTTTVLDFAEPERGASLASALDAWHSRAEGAACCHYGFHMTVKDWSPAVKAELADMDRAGVSSYKVYFAYDDLRVSDGAALEIVRSVGERGGIVGCHCENGELVGAGIKAQKAAGNLGPWAHPLSRPAAVEAEAVGRWLAVGELAGYPVNIVHLSAARSLEIVRAARARGQKVYVETCPQYLLLDEEKYRLPGFESAKFVLSPPLRGREDVDALWAGLEAGDVDTIGTDHCSFHFRGVKELGREDFSQIPNGIPGVEHRPVLLYTAGVASGRMSAHQLMKLLSEQPARLFGMYPRKGALAVGGDADLVIFDPDHKGRVTAAAQHQAADYTPYEGFETRGRVETVLLSGEMAVEDGRVTAKGRGRFVRRGPSQFWR
ncbi:MAG: dihydropyrimidinase [Oscillospiraceae bacterium]|nr:dihydropyrimidinase [Oscillospiraceae bacterium]MCI9308668.1 dihydropyrimidinase [Oscillospiraceae bacterium]MCI9549637.1 dihydropyrimidinase [Oscillospiraceae bacterium]